MDNLAKVRAEVEKLNAKLLRGACSSQVAMETMCKEEAYNEVLAILDSIQKEPVSEKLEDAASSFARKDSEGISNPANFYYIVTDKARIFKAGAKWQKEQIMAKVVDGEVTYGKSLAIPSLGWVLDKEELDFGDKVKLIFIKED